MVEFIGLLKVKVLKGTNLAIRDMMTSDPYVILTLGRQVSHLSHLLFLHTEASESAVFSMHEEVYVPTIFLSLDVTSCYSFKVAPLQ